MSFAFHVSVLFLALSLSIGGPVLGFHQFASSPPAAQNPADDTALRALAEEFFKRWAAKDLDHFLQLWNAQSPV